MRTIYKFIIGLYFRFHELFWYGVVGIVNSIINVVVFCFFVDVLNINYLIANGSAWMVAVISAYVTNKLWVFESKSWKKSVWIPECLEFISARLTTGALDMVLMHVMISVVGILEIWAKLISNIVVIIGNYLLSKLWIFRSDRR